ncbi:caspase family protein [Catenulispora pinisilvae]|uniref:caspase family protein n=1 Tax=Catenulispora pinisilvae TaxID=2705253 RepID=UPI001891B13F|nr:caspase family protein [Catenulispora pinisilvae]
MSERALLVGAAVDGLTGVENDVEAMARTLTARGFTVEPLTGKLATRAGILDAYERLISDSGPGDTAVVYYSGHGGRVLPPAAGTPGHDLMDLQFIVPFDFHDSGPDDFRGITSVELSVLLARLTQRTDNVVAMFDCCHSGRVSRDNRLRVKAVPRTTPYERLRTHIERLRRDEGLRTDLLRATGNPDAVRIVACAPEQAAFEYPGAEGEQIGVFTEALTMALHAAGTEPVSWATLLDGVRYRVSALVSGQRPEAEGPARRLLFATREDDHLDMLRATDAGGGRLSLECAPLLGVRPGDAFTVWSPAGDRIGDLTVDRAGPLAAQGPVTLAPGITEIPLGARARQTAATAPTLAVSIPAADPRALDLARALTGSPLLRLVDKDDRWDAQVRIDATGDLTVADRIGPLHEPRPNGPAGVTGTVGDLTTLARAAALRGLSSDTRWSLNARVVCEWGLVRDGERHRLPDSGATVRVAETVYVSVRNEGDLPVYAALVDIGVSGLITVLTDFAPSGVRLVPGGQEEYVYGLDDYSGVLEGVAMEWPDGLEPAYARPETVLLFVTSDPHDLSALTQRGVARAGSGSGAESPLTAVLNQIATGRSRELRSASGPAGSYDVRVMEFDVEPAAVRTGFLIEEVSFPRPKGPTGLAGATPRTAPATVAVRLNELIVHHNRARFGGASVRVDAMVLTGTPDSLEPTFRAQTERFSRIRDGEPLPLDQMLVYHGPAADYLDIALWVSRDTAGALDLGELLTDEVAGFEVQEALAKMSETVTGAPYATAAAALVGAGAVVVNLAYRLLRGSVNDVIGLYRGSMLAGERFGVGRHPAEGVRRVQDFSFAYTIDEVS